jgi:hypothetical protein
MARDPAELDLPRPYGQAGTTLASCPSLPTGHPHGVEPTAWLAALAQFGSIWRAPPFLQALAFNYRSRFARAVAPGSRRTGTHAIGVGRAPTARRAGDPVRP